MLIAGVHLQRAFNVVNEKGQTMKRLVLFVINGGEVEIYDDEE